VDVIFVGWHVWDHSIEEGHGDPDLSRNFVAFEEKYHLE
jgi:hypothetical protein